MKHLFKKYMNTNYGCCSWNNNPFYLHLILNLQVNKINACRQIVRSEAKRRGLSSSCNGLLF